MLNSLRAILLALFIAAPIGEQQPGENPESMVGDYAPEAVLTCPVTPRSPLDVNALAAGEDAAAAHPYGFGENA